MDNADKLDLSKELIRVDLLFALAFFLVQNFVIVSKFQTILVDMEWNSC